MLLCILCFFNYTIDYEFFFLCLLMQEAAEVPEGADAAAATNAAAAAAAIHASASADDVCRSKFCQAHRARLANRSEHARKLGGVERFRGLGRTIVVQYSNVPVPAAMAI